MPYTIMADAARPLVPLDAQATGARLGE